MLHINAGKSSPEINLGQSLHNIHGLHAHIDDTEQHIQNIARVADLFGPVVGIIGNAAFLVRLDLVAFHDPFHGRLAVDHVLIGLSRDTGKGYFAVVQDTVPLSFLGEAHFLHPEKAAGRSCHGHPVVRGHGFIVDMQISQGPACFAEGPKIGNLIKQGQAGQHLFQVVGKGGAVFRAVQDAVHVIENIFLGYALVVLLLCPFEDKITDAVSADVFGVAGGVEQARLFFLALVVPVEGEALTAV